MAWEQDEQTVSAASENGARDVYLANCNHGPSVTPEYRFFLRDESTGTETPLTDLADGRHSLLRQRRTDRSVHPRLCPRAGRRRRS